FLAALSLAAVGCKKGGADCGKAVDHSMELSKAEMQKMPGMDDATLQKLKDIGVQHCKEDKWPDDVVSCMTAAKTEADSQACYGKLTPEQQKKMNHALMETMSAKAAAPTTGSAAMGSAEAGSAMA